MRYSRRDPPPMEFDLPSPQAAVAGAVGSVGNPVFQGLGTSPADSTAQTLGRSDPQIPPKTRKKEDKIRTHGNVWDGFAYMDCVRAGGASGLLLGVDPREQVVGQQSPDAPGQQRMRFTDGLQALVNSTICPLKLPFDTERRVGRLGECLVQAEQRLGKDHGPEVSGVTGRRNAEPLVFFSLRGYVRRSVDDPD